MGLFRTNVGYSFWSSTILSAIALIAVTTEVRAGLTSTARKYVEDGASGPGLYDAIHKVMPISMVEPKNAQFVEMAKLGFDKYHGNVIIQNPKSRFAVFMWQEDAAGNKMGILDSGEGGDLPGPWRKSMGDRFWTGKWSEDIVVFSWSPDGMEMVIGNGDVFNDAGIYWLDLLNKKSKRLASSHDKGEVKKIDWEKKLIKTAKGKIVLPTAGVRGKFVP